VARFAEAAWSAEADEGNRGGLGIHPPLTMLRAFAVNAFEPCIALPVLAVVHRFGLLGYSPLWVWVVLLFANAVLQQPAVQRWLGGGDVRDRLWLRLALHLGLVTTGMYLAGWGALLSVAHIVALSVQLRWSGARAWRPAAVWSVLGISCGQAAIGLGWVHSYVPEPRVHGMAVLIALGTALICRLLGRSAEQRERAEAALRQSAERFRALVQDSSDVITVSDEAGRIVYISPATERVMGYSPDDVSGTAYLGLIHPEDLAAAESMRAGVLTYEGVEHRTELRVRHSDGSWRWHEVTVRNLLGNPAVRGIVASHRDVTERRAIQELLAYDASHDALTGQLNRAAFLRGLEQALAEATRERRQLAVLFVDLDGFKRVNDTLGHDAGDALLVAAGRMIQRNVLGCDAVGRLGGDEFGVVLTSVDTPEQAVAVAKWIVAEMDRPLAIADQAVHARASIGIAVSRPGSTDAKELLRRADTAMYRAKRQKHSGWQLYVDGMADHDADLAALESDLRDAVRAGELRLQYQPIVALDSGDLVGLEALVRWEHPIRGWLTPQDFIPLAEQAGIIGQLGEWVLEHACLQARRWQQRISAVPRLRLSVNLAPAQLERESLVGTVMAILHRTGFEPSDLVLEVTESALVDDKSAVPQLVALSEQGIRIALDDFGTGYSSLRYLTRLPVDILKLDRCFVAELNGTPEGSAVAEAVVRLGQILHLDTVAEGIESAAQAGELTLMGCRAGQGYHFAGPLDAASIDALLLDPTQEWPAVPVSTRGRDSRSVRTGSTGQRRPADPTRRS
jgi:diguanylate cyclase (GGDEF)-like protein/PAS domain S-box-containing protein